MSGLVFFSDAFNGYLAEIDEDRGVFPSLGVAPASNRVVLFSDNQITELDRQASEVIEAVESQNQIDGIAGLRELIVGQLKAGRELIRAGTFRLYFLQMTLIQSLRFLAERYEKEMIGGLAAALIAALLKLIGIEA